ncbi:family 10 glycosylhydrolase [Ectobacillus antri]|uniref:Family 10 glycosylhydrolase n=1 Tax=Ectobacillus antri TaxID=2486280 RepID=A0ABT6H2P8_9BACI|nr:family 10 glycosylhydrolase [Ectobacillus antri]MDG4656051.1 family 10 glycosylhydrolase [Ectobacillus antri]MDG5752726.1 family 10 glycosylhydrolase [Ectobacillus antri]
MIYTYKRIWKTMLVLCLLLSTLVPFVSYETVKAETQSGSKREMRAAWVSTVWNLDWPKTKNDAQAQKVEFISLLNRLKATGMNAVIVQVRPMGDALYPTNLAPWSQFLTGVQGKDPGYNPLEFMITEAHKRNMEFHAWFNPFRVATGSTNINNLAASNPARVHPEWKVDYNNGMYYNPGLPEVRDYIKNTILEVVKNYDVDAIHLDDYFYPDIKNDADFNDAQTFEKYPNGFTNIGDWRRNNINLFVNDLSKGIKATKPYVKFGISPNGIWKNIPKGDGTYTTGMESYYRVYADSLKWVKQNWIDYIAPQVYWKFGHKAAPYEVVTNWWSEQVKGTNVHLYIGHADYKLNTYNSLEDWRTSQNEISNQIMFNRQKNVAGSMHFRSETLQQNVLSIASNLQNGVYQNPAIIPAMTHIDKTPPSQPQGISVSRSAQGVTISWKATSGANAYAIYRFKRGEAHDLEDATKLIATIHSSQSLSFLDKNASPKEEYEYAVTALDRLQNESAPAFAKTLSPFQMWVDQPSVNASIKGTANVSGWALAESGISKVELLMDGQVIGQANYGVLRTDVYNVYPQYNNQNSGFTYKLNTLLYKTGAHQLGVRITDSNGLQHTQQVPVQVLRNLPLRYSLDSLWDGIKINGNQNISGWALAEDGIAEVQVLVDGVQQGNATLEVSRPDVYAVYPQYKNQNSGYRYSLDTRTLTQGLHTVSLLIKTKGGDVQTVQSRVEVVRALPMRSSVDSIRYNQDIAATQRISGWALAEDGIEKVEILVDGKLQGIAKYGISRPDVYNVYPKYNNKNSGYEYLLNTGALSAGKHTVTVRSISKAGDVQATDTVVNVVKLPMRMYLDQPAPNKAVGKMQTVSGWALSENGVAKVEVLVDGMLKGTAQYGISRSDVAKVFPLYNTSNSGFTYTLDTAGLTKGTHTVTIRVTDQKGIQTSTSSPFLVSPLHGKTIVLDPGHGGIDSGAVYGTYYEKDIVLNVALRLRALLQSHGATVAMTRSTDTQLNLDKPTDLKMRAEVANNLSADAFVSIHVNSSVDTNVSGIETYYHPTAGMVHESNLLANSIQSALISSTNARNRYVKTADFSVLRNNERPAVLTELGFISNPLERALLISPKYQQTQAQALFNGLYNYVD